MSGDARGPAPDDGRTAEDTTYVIEYACHVLADCSRGQVTEVTRFETGENHAVYRLAYAPTNGAAKDVVIRVATSERARDCAAATREAAVLLKVQGLAAPLLYDFRCENEWFGAPVMCTEFADSMPQPPLDAPERLGRAVGRVHALPTRDLREDLADPGTAEAYLDERLANLAAKVSWIRDPLPTAVQSRLRSAAARVTEHAVTARTSGDFETTESLVLLHGDPVAGNILWTPDPILIDWEYARIGDPADEIAYIFMEHDWSEEQRTEFWRGYREGCAEQRPVDRGITRVGWWEPITTLGSAFFWVQLWSRRAAADVTGKPEPTAPKDQAHYAAGALSRLRHLETLLGRPSP